LLMAIGTIFVFSAGVDVVKGIDLKNFYQSANLRKVLFFPLAVAVMLLVSRINYHRFSMQKGLLRSPITYLLILAVFLLVIVLIPQIGTQINQARRWLRDSPRPGYNKLSAKRAGKMGRHFFFSRFLRQIQ